MSNGERNERMAELLGRLFAWLVMKQSKGNKALGCLYMILDLAVLAAVLYGVGILGKWQGWW